MTDNSATYPVGGYRNAPGVSATPADPTPSQPSGVGLPSGSLTVNPEDLQSAARGFSDLGSQMASLYQNLAQTLNSNNAGGVPWGNDSLGQSFGEQYVPVSQNTLQAVQGLSQLFDGIGSTLGEAAKTFRQAEDYNMQLASKLA
jgi:uncharacterized protein YukE